MVLMLLCLFSASTMLTSCDDDEGTDQIVLQSFGPSGVHHGDKIRFIGLNLDKVTAIVLPPAIEIGKSQFNTQSSEIIEITVPAEAEAGKVILKTPQGNIESKSVLNFEVPVEITAITEEAEAAAQSMEPPPRSGADIPPACG